MHSNSNSDPEYLDDALADFADRLMRGAASDDLDNAARELADLQAMTRQVKSVFEASHPDREVAQRIRANLVKEWERLGYSESQPSAWQRLWQRAASSQKNWLSGRWQRQAYALSLAGLVVVVLITALVLEAGGGGGIVGATPDEAPLFIIGAVVITGLGMLSWWLLRRR